jgi:uncharacterized repeat protein (TIGR01451 family)
MKAKRIKFASAVLMSAAMLVGFGCGSHQERATDTNGIQNDRVDFVAVDLDDAQPDPWWEPRGPNRAKPAPVQNNEPAPAPVRANDGRGSVSAAYPTGDARTSAIFVEKFFPTVVNAGAPFEYEIRVTNLTSLDLDNVRVWDNVPNNFKLDSATPNPDSASAGNLMWNLGSMGPREVKTIKVRGSAPEEGTVQACAKVAYDTSLCNEILVVKPALDLAVAITPEVLLCDPITIKYTVCNRGTGPATNVVVTKTLPNGLTTANGSSEVRFTVPRLGAGECADFTVMAKAASTGTYSVDGAAKADGGLAASAGAQQTVVRQPELTIAVECPGRILAGRNVPEVPITVTVKNTGNAASANTVVEAPVPAGTTFARASDGGANAGGTIRWNVGSLAAGATRTLSFVVQPGQRGTVDARARVVGECANAATDGCQVDILGIPAVLLEVVDMEDPIRVGDNVTYRISVTNQGSAPDRQIAIVCNFEGEAQFVDASGRHEVNGQTITFSPVPVLNAKERVTFEVTLKAIKAGDIRFAVTMNTEELKRPVQETEATNFYE